MEYLLGGIVLAFLLLLVLGAATGRADLRSCCSVADPSRDLRMRAAYEADPAGAGDAAGVVRRHPAPAKPSEERPSSRATGAVRAAGARCR